jgi:hypothetical protein
MPAGIEILETLCSGRAWRRRANFSDWNAYRSRAVAFGGGSARRRHSRVCKQLVAGIRSRRGSAIGETAGDLRRQVTSNVVANQLQHTERQLPLEGVRGAEFGVRVPVRRVGLEGRLPVFGRVARSDVVTRVDLELVRVLEGIVGDCVTHRPGGEGQARKQEDQSGSARRGSDRHPVTPRRLLGNWKKGPFDGHAGRSLSSVVLLAEAPMEDRAAAEVLSDIVWPPTLV